MITLTPQQVAERCAGIMWPDDKAAQGLGIELVRVAPGSPEASYLYLKVRGDGGIDGDVMPQDRGYDPRVDRLVRDWIAAGAPVP